MKILKTLFFYIILIQLCSCSKNEIENANGNVKFQENTYELNHAYLERIELNNFIQLRLYLSENKIDFKDDNFEIKKPNKAYLAFILHNPNSNFENISDYYPLSTEYENINMNNNIPFLISSKTKFLIKNSTENNNNVETEYNNFDWDDGSLTLDNNNNKLNINFALKKDGKLVKGEFIGIAQEININY